MSVHEFVHARHRKHNAYNACNRTSCRSLLNNKSSIIKFDMQGLLNNKVRDAGACSMIKFDKCSGLKVPDLRGRLLSTA